MYVLASSIPRPRRDARLAHIAAVSAIATASAVETAATSRLVKNEFRTRASPSASPYHFVVNPPQPTSNSSAFREFATTSPSGTQSPSRTTIDATATPEGRFTTARLRSVGGASGR